MQELTEFLQSFPFLGDATVAILVVVLVLTGKLIPRSALQDVLEERNAWREAYQAELKVSQEIRRQNGELLEVAKLSEHLLTSFKEKMP